MFVSGARALDCSRWQSQGIVALLSLSLYCIVLLRLPLQHMAGVNGGPNKIGQRQQGEHKIIHGYRVEINCIVIT